MQALDVGARRTQQLRHLAPVLGTVHLDDLLEGHVLVLRPLAARGHLPRRPRLEPGRLPRLLLLDLEQLRVQASVPPSAGAMSAELGAAGARVGEIDAALARGRAEIYLEGLSGPPALASVRLMRQVSFRKLHFELAYEYVRKWDQRPDDEIKGTGGTPFMPYLRKHRRTTYETLIDKNATLA